MKAELVKIENAGIDEYFARLDIQGIVVLCPVGRNVTEEVAKEAFVLMNIQGFKWYKSYDSEAFAGINNE